ncbi:MAG: NUDIX domain-containing protein [Carnobacterium inhibens]
MKQEKSCGAVIVTKETEEPKFLLIKHHNGGHWAFPKGHVEGNETEEETALREIMEETHLTVELDTQFRHVVRYSPYEGTVKDVIYFMAYTSEQEIHKQDEEVLDSSWSNFEEALALVTYENDRTILQAAKDYLTKKNS